jgi:cytoskeleton protein RodZ
LWVLVVLLAGAGAVRWWPGDLSWVADLVPRRSIESPESTKSVDTVPMGGAAAVAMGATNMVEVASAPSEGRPFPAMAPLVPAESPVAAASGPDAVLIASSPKVSGGTSVSTEAPARAASAPTLTKPGHALLISVHEACWTEVVDAKGQALLSRLLSAGESVGLDGVEPMRVKLGRANAAELWFKGRKVDLTSWTRDNLARVDLQ